MCLITGISFRFREYYIQQVLVLYLFSSVRMNMLGHYSSVTFVHRFVVVILDGNKSQGR